MSKKLFYFSGTGNTLHLAKKIAENVPGLELVKIRYDMNFDCTDCDTVGIAYPVYCFTLPNIVANFINNATFSSSAYIFSLASFGGFLASSNKIMNKILRAKGLNLSAGFSVHMPGNATNVYDVASKEKQEAMFSKASEKITQIASMVKTKAPGKIDSNLGILGDIASGFSGFMMSKVNETDKTFSVNDTCDSCGICVKVCPVGNVSLVNGKPQWKHNCESCLACFHWCPKAAIQSGTKTSQRGRYHHPQVNLADIANDK
ncbi:MAG: EFR1 family ferrodoxin [Fibrobacter sp.]|nr:EFR1 family ferrodoxin [Fibrobacter sp.]